MEPIDIHKASESSYSSIQEERAVPETVDLLEESWFFGNLLNNQKPKMSRCYSDPCPSSITKLSHDMSFKISLENNQNSSMSTSKTEAKAEDFRPNLVRTPSLPLNIGRKEEEEGIQVRHGDNKVSKMNHEVVQPTELHLGKKEGTREKERNSTRSKTTGQSVPLQPSKSMLVRTQTLPTSIKRVELNQDQEESHRTMSKSSRQVSFNLADILPPRHNKGASRYRTPKNTVVEGIDTDGSREMRRRYLNGKNLRRSLSDLEIEEVQGFKDLGFTFDNKDKISPSVVNILPGLQEKKKEDMDLENKVRRPYLSEAWLVQSCAPPPPPTPNWAARKSSEDMKAQIKFWARAVASNVR